MLDMLPQVAPSLLLAEDGSWFQVDDQPAVSIATRTTLRRLLLALVDHARTGTVLSSPRAFALGWPGERALPKAAATRVYTAIHTLRRFGLAAAIRRRGMGYVLLAQVQVAAAPSEPLAALAS